MEIRGTPLNPGATNLYSAVEIKKPSEVGQTLSSGGAEAELEVEDVLRISPEMDQEGGGDSAEESPPQEKQKKESGGAADCAADEEPPEDPMSLWG